MGPLKKIRATKRKKWDRERVLETCCDEIRDDPEVNH